MFQRLGLVFILHLSSGIGFAADTPDFTRQVRPILSDKCFQCHGPDAAQRKEDLRFDLVGSAIAHGAIVPGDPASSPLVERIRHPEAGKRMPPPESKLELSEAERETLVAWIAGGAPHERHWSFVPPRRTAMPETNEHAIDRIVREDLEAEGLGKAVEADRTTLARRVSLDLTGLPPEPALRAAFLADDSAEAYERYVDALLDSPAYGEQMATLWLDVARYADTYGYQSDRENHVWPWRDWVIRAFNDNLPYDDFIRWQLAGDLLPSPTQDQRIATAFNRLHRQTNEGGSVLEEYRTEYVVDRVNTFGTAFLGMTMECARCHDHKFDPISQAEYYGLFAFFDDIDESGMYSHFTEVTPSPSLLLESEERAKKRRLIEMLVGDREREFEDALRNATVRSPSPAVSVSLPDPIAHLSFDGDAPVLPDEAEVKIPGDANKSPGRSGEALVFSGDSGVEITKTGKFERTDPFSLALHIKAPKTMPRAVLVHRSMAAEDAASRGYELILEDGRLTARLSHFWPGNAICVQAVDEFPAKVWTHVALTYDGSSRAEGLTLYVGGERVETRVVRDKLRKTIQYSPGGDSPPLMLAARFRDYGFKDGAIDEFMVFDIALTAAEVRLLVDAEDMITESEREGHYVARLDQAVSEAREKLHAARVDLAAHVDETPSLMTMQHMAGPRIAYRLERGEYDKRAEPVGPDTPASVLPFPDDLPHNRLGLAEWLLRPDNPLTARVAVNRLWQNFFGRGLVATQEDFGNQGSPPSHPELLDLLALRFSDSGWNVKDLCRYIVTSQTYRQESRANAELRRRDPENVLLARGPGHRLSAEQIRDAALASSDLLVRRIGGPSVKPYQPPGLWKEAGSLTYQADSGDGLYRRSMYTYWKRTVPPPAMLTFDAQNREVCVARRERTFTPLQSLLLLNGTQFVEAARVLAENVVRDSGGVDDVFERLLGRRPDEGEREILQRALREQQSFFAKDVQAASAYVSTGEHAVDQSLDPVQVAALAAVAQLIMNFDGFIMKQ